MAWCSARIALPPTDEGLAPHATVLSLQVLATSLVREKVLQGQADPQGPISPCRDIQTINTRMRAEEGMRADLLAQRSRRLFMTGDLDSKIANLDRSLAERREALARAQKALALADGAGS